MTQSVVVRECIHVMADSQKPGMIRFGATWYVRDPDVDLEPKVVRL